MTIQIFLTGGTFDKEYNKLNGELFFRETHISEMLKLGRSSLDVDIKTLMMVDSLDMSDEDREIITQNCIETNSDKVLITHGTDRMVETAQAIAHKVNDKTIILTGAMIPYKFGSSDGLFNLGSSLAFAQTLPNGVYISMNGKIFSWHNVRKNKEQGLFESIN